MSIAEICHHLCPAATPDERQISHDGHDTNLIRATYCCPTHAFTIARTARKPPHKMAMSYHPLGVSRMPYQSQLANKTMILVNLGHRVSRFLAVSTPVKPSNLARVELIESEKRRWEWSSKQTHIGRGDRTLDLERVKLTS